MALSKLTDAPDKVMKFELKGEENDEASWYQSLVAVEDRIGQPSDLTKLGNNKTVFDEGAAKPSQRRKPNRGPNQSLRSDQNRSKIISIEEVSDESEAEDLISYEKPDSDASDSEEDATLIDRSKPTAPM